MKRLILVQTFNYPFWNKNARSHGRINIYNRQYIVIESRRYFLVYGLKPPGCILCLKLFIICFSLIYFCELFSNVTMMIMICFIWQLGGHSNNFAPVLPKTNFSRPPRGPKSQQEPITYLKSARVSQSQPESSKVIQCRSESARVSKILPESARVLDRFWGALKISFW